MQVIITHLNKISGEVEESQTLPCVTYLQYDILKSQPVGYFFTISFYTKT